MFSNLILVFAFFFLTVNGNAQEKCYEIIYNHRKIIHFSKDSTFAVAESDVNHEFNLKFSNLKLSFKNNQLFVNNNKVYCFTNVEFYEKFIHFTKNKKDYIYIYPQYENYYTPYTHLELGILVEIKNGKFIIKEKIDSIDDDEIFTVKNFKNFKILKQKQDNCAGFDIGK